MKNVGYVVIILISNINANHKLLLKYLEIALFNSYYNGLY